MMTYIGESGVLKGLNDDEASPVLQNGFTYWAKEVTTVRNGKVVNVCFVQTNENFKLEFEWIEL